MPARKKRILFFTPSGTRTGSEMMLLYIVRNIDRSRFDVAVVSFERGELLAEFPPDVPIFVVPKAFNLWQKTQFYLGRNPILAALRRLARSFKADLWYVNTMMLPETAIVAQEYSIKLVTHFHELPLTYRYINADEMKSVVTYSHTLVGCSEVTSEAIRQIGGENVTLLYEFVDPENLNADPARTAQIRRELGIAPDDFVWVGSGTSTERKGFDLLPEIAEALDDPKIHLVWVGSLINDGLVYYVEQRCARTKSKTRIHLVGEKKGDYAHYLNAGDGFMLTSRQDPFPLVMIEAATLGKPIVAFPSGGVAEFVQEGMGLVTEDISVRQMVAAMRRIMNGEVQVDAAKSRKRAAEFSVENGFRQWTELLESVL